MTERKQHFDRSTQIFSEMTETKTQLIIGRTKKASGFFIKLKWLEALIDDPVSNGPIIRGLILSMKPDDAAPGVEAGQYVFR